MAFVGFKFALGRRLQPTCYSIRNRPMGSYAMLSWRFEASNDLVNWHLLDIRREDLHSEEMLS